DMADASLYRLPVSPVALVLLSVCHSPPPTFVTGASCNPGAATSWGGIRHNASRVPQKGRVRQAPRQNIRARRRLRPQPRAPRPWHADCLFRRRKVMHMRNAAWVAPTPLAEPRLPEFRFTSLLATQPESLAKGRATTVTVSMVVHGVLLAAIILVPLMVE